MTCQNGLTCDITDGLTLLGLGPGGVAEEEADGSILPDSLAPSVMPTGSRSRPPLLFIILMETLHERCLFDIGRGGGGQDS